MKLCKKVNVVTVTYPYCKHYISTTTEQPSCHTQLVRTSCRKCRLAVSTYNMCLVEHLAITYLICVVYEENGNMRLAVMGVHTVLSLLSVILLAVV